MKTASQELVNEHNAILQVLNILETVCAKITSEGTYDKNDLEDILEFLKIFADKCHHGKEEGLLFPALEETGMKKEFGPIAVMLSEHVMGRGFIKQMDEALNSNPLNTAGFADASENYIHLLRAHIQKENQILFPMGDRRLPESKQDELLKEFEKFENDVIGNGKHEEFHAMINKLQNKYL
ncbi:MAG: hemerythrin domain-containing protein [Ignavibacteria bacterium]|jgi:hemerythrin-like domain-containing protein|nr:hemerythrin domain-containing protein [Ignavibacteria bacterium]